MEHTTNTPPAPDRRRLQTTLTQVVSRFSPEQIVLFGSASRHEMAPDSDVDLLVIRERLNGEPETDRKRWDADGDGYEADLILMDHGDGADRE